MLGRAHGKLIYVIESVPESSATILSNSIMKKKSVKILHVDDDPSFLKVAKRCLKMQDEFQVETASSVEEAWEKMKIEEYDAIVSDYQMPGKDGLQFLKELREKGDATPFVMFTGRGREEVAIKALNLGADQYLNKSGNPEAVYFELAHSIRKAVERRNALDLLKESEEKYKGLVENSKDSIVIIDLKGNVLFANKATEELTGYVDRTTRMNVRKVTPLKYWPKSLAMLLKAKKGEKVPYFETMIKRKDGIFVPVETGGQGVFEDGKVVGIQIITRDISDRKRRESAQKARRLMLF
jgi:PAS domain S-box-containing protein